MPQCHRLRPPRRKGFVLIVSIFFLFLLALIGSALIGMVPTEMLSESRNRIYTQSHYAGLAGIQHAKTWITYVITPEPISSNNAYLGDNGATWSNSFFGGGGHPAITNDPMSAPTGGEFNVIRLQDLKVGSPPYQKTGAAALGYTSDDIDQANTLVLTNSDLNGATPDTLQNNGDYRVVTTIVPDPDTPGGKNALPGSAYVGGGGSSGSRCYQVVSVVLFQGIPKLRAKAIILEDSFGRFAKYSNSLPPGNVTPNGSSADTVVLKPNQVTGPQHTNAYYRLSVGNGVWSATGSGWTPTSSAFSGVMTYAGSNAGEVNAAAGWNQDGIAWQNGNNNHGLLAAFRPFVAAGSAVGVPSSSDNPSLTGTRYDRIITGGQSNIVAVAPIKLPTTTSAIAAAAFGDVQTVIAAPGSTVVPGQGKDGVFINNNGSKTTGGIYVRGNVNQVMLEVVDPTGKPVTNANDLATKSGTAADANPGLRIQMSQSIVGTTGFTTTPGTTTPGTTSPAVTHPATTTPGHAAVTHPATTTPGTSPVTHPATTTPGTAPITNPATTTPGTAPVTHPAVTLPGPPGGSDSTIPATTTPGTAPVTHPATTTPGTSPVTHPATTTPGTAAVTNPATTTPAVAAVTFPSTTTPAVGPVTHPATTTPATTSPATTTAGTTTPQTSSYRPVDRVVQVQGTVPLVITPATPTATQKYNDTTMGPLAWSRSAGARDTGSGAPNTITMAGMTCTQMLLIPPGGGPASTIVAPLSVGQGNVVLMKQSRTNPLVMEISVIPGPSTTTPVVNGAVYFENDISNLNGVNAVRQTICCNPNGAKYNGTGAGTVANAGHIGIADNILQFGTAKGQKPTNADSGLGIVSNYVNIVARQNANGAGKFNDQILDPASPAFTGMTIYAVMMAGYSTATGDSGGGFVANGDKLVKNNDRTQGAQTAAFNNGNGKYGNGLTQYASGRAPTLAFFGGLIEAQTKSRGCGDLSGGAPGSVGWGDNFVYDQSLANQPPPYFPKDGLMIPLSYIEERL